MSGGAGARTLRGRVHQENRGDRGWSSAPTYPAIKPAGNRVGSGDEISRSGNLPFKAGASQRTSRYTGPDGTNHNRGRGPISYKEGQIA
jgi:hypothetical protein